MKIPKKITILTHYFKEDKSFLSDYASVDVLFDDELIKQYDDYYHDKGDIRAEEFVEGYLVGIGKENRAVMQVEYVKVADYE